MNTLVVLPLFGNNDTTCSLTLLFLSFSAVALHMHTKHWKEPICGLLKYWGQLETRTRQVLDLLRLASEQRCSSSTSSTLPTTASTSTVDHLRGNNTTTQIPSRAERKLKDKRKKALVAVEDIMSRGDDNPTSNSYSTTTTNINKTKTNSNTLECLYVPFAKLLQERANVRALWKKREGDHVFRIMGAEYKPIPVPFHFNALQVGGGVVGVEGDEVGMSPIEGTPEGLSIISEDLIRLGNAFLSGRGADLPKRTYISTVCTSMTEERSEAKATVKGKQEKQRKKIKFVSNTKTGFKKKRRF